MKTKVHKVTVLIVDHDDIGAVEVASVLENALYPNHCVSPQVAWVDTIEVEWSDAHPLNQIHGWRQAFTDLFGSCLHRRS